MPLVIVATADVVSVCLAVLVLRRRHPLWGRRRLRAGLPVWREPTPRVDPGFEHRPWTDRDSAFAQMEFGRRGQDGIPSIAFIAPQWSMN
jgi:hypothetical protein